MQPEENKKEEASSTDDRLLERILTEAADLVFPEPDDLPEATEAEMDHLMTVTAQARKRPSRILQLIPKKVLALAASLFLIAGVGLFFLTGRPVNSVFTVAVALPKAIPGLVFRGGDPEPDELSKVVESGVLDALDAQLRTRSADFRMFDAPLSQDGLGKVLVSQLPASGSRNILYVTTDEERGELVLMVFRARTGEELGEVRLELDNAAHLQDEVSAAISVWMRDGLL